MITREEYYLDTCPTPGLLAESARAHSEANIAALNPAGFANGRRIGELACRDYEIVKASQSGRSLLVEPPNAARHHLALERLTLAGRDQSTADPPESVRPAKTPLRARWTNDRSLANRAVGIQLLEMHHAMIRVFRFLLLLL